MTLSSRFSRDLSAPSLLCTLYFFPIWTFTALADASLVNITVDDNSASPQIVYAPPGIWSLGPNCQNCVARPDPSKAYDGTWHDITFLPMSESESSQTASLSFEGSAIYVYCVIAPTSPGLDGYTNMLFFLDGHLAGSLIRDTTGQTDYQYNVLVYANTSISPGPNSHTFTLQNGHPGGSTSLAMLDYIVYSVEDNSNEAPSTTSSSFFPSISPPFKTSSSFASSSTRSTRTHSVGNNGSNAVSSTSFSSSLPPPMSPASQTSSFSATSSSSSLPNKTALSANTHTHTRTLTIAIACSLGGVVFLIFAFMCYRRLHRDDDSATDGRRGGEPEVETPSGFANWGGSRRRRDLTVTPFTHSQQRLGASLEVKSTPLAVSPFFYIMRTSSTVDAENTDNSFETQEMPEVELPLQDSELPKPSMGSQRQDTPPPSYLNISRQSFESHVEVGIAI